MKIKNKKAIKKHKSFVTNVMVGYIIIHVTTLSFLDILVNYLIPHQVVVIPFFIALGMVRTGELLLLSLNPKINYLMQVAWIEDESKLQKTTLLPKILYIALFSGIFILSFYFIHPYITYLNIALQAFLIFGIVRIAEMLLILVPGIGDTMIRVYFYRRKNNE